MLAVSVETSGASGNVETCWQVAASHQWGGGIAAVAADRQLLHEADSGLVTGTPMEWWGQMKLAGAACGNLTGMDHASPG